MYTSNEAASIASGESGVLLMEPKGNFGGSQQSCGDSCRFSPIAIAKGMYNSGSYSLQCLNNEYYERQCSGEGKRKIQIRRQISGGCQQEDVVPVLTR